MFLKISYLERENKTLTSKINDLTQGKAIDKELLDTVLNKIDDSVAEESNDSRTIVVLQKKIGLLEGNVSSLEKLRDSLHAQLLIQEQVRGDSSMVVTRREEDLKEEMQELKENLDRKEYLLQFNEQKYYQYEKVLRELILNRNTDEGVKD